MTRTTPPRIAIPVEHQSVRYQQDGSNAADKEHGAIYLAAHDSASDALLWRVKITDPIRHAANSPAGNSIRPINLTRIAVGPNEGQLTIETEFGARYLVDLVEKRSTCIFNPDDQVRPKAAGTQPPLPPPLPPTGR